jgi:hypothetical protein
MKKKLQTIAATIWWIWGGCASVALAVWFAYCLFLAPPLKGPADGPGHWSCPQHVNPYYSSGDDCVWEPDDGDVGGADWGAFKHDVVHPVLRQLHLR